MHKYVRSVEIEKTRRVYIQKGGYSLLSIEISRLCPSNLKIRQKTYSNRTNRTGGGKRIESRQNHKDFALYLYKCMMVYLVIK